jgi:hypothetical protein
VIFGGPLRLFRPRKVTAVTTNLYLSFEATYTRKCFFFEKIAKNWFWRVQRWKISSWRFSQKVSISCLIALPQIWPLRKFCTIKRVCKTIWSREACILIPWKFINGRGPFSGFQTLNLVTKFFLSKSESLWGQFYSRIWKPSLTSKWGQKLFELIFLYHFQSNAKITI